MPHVPFKCDNCDFYGRILFKIDAECTLKNGIEAIVVTAKCPSCNKVFESKYDTESYTGKKGLPVPVIETKKDFTFEHFKFDFSKLYNEVSQEIFEKQKKKMIKEQGIAIFIVDSEEEGKRLLEKGCGYIVLEEMKIE